MRLVADQVEAAFLGEARESLLAELATVFTNSARQQVARIYGEAGVGKTTMLRALLLRAQEHHGARVLSISGERVAPNTHAIGEQLNAFRLASCEDSVETPRLEVICLDGFEQLAHIELQIRQMVFNQASADRQIVLLLGIRGIPNARAAYALRSSASFKYPESDREFLIPPMDQFAATSLLTARGVPQAVAQQIARASKGNPLLINFAMQSPAELDDLEFDLALLAESFLDEAPTELHADALRSICLSFATDRALLASILGVDDVRALYRWLAGLSFVEVSAYGLTPHDLVRRAVFQELAMRHPRKLEAFGEAAVRDIVARLPANNPHISHRLSLEAMFAARRSPQLHSYVFSEEARRTTPRLARPGDEDVLAAAVLRHEGAASAALFRSCFATQPENFFVLTEGSDTPTGLVAPLSVRRLLREQWEADAALAATRVFLKDVADTDEVRCTRFFFALDTYQEFGPTMTSCMMVSPLFIEPPRILSVVVANPDRWQPLAPSFLLNRLVGYNEVRSGTPLGLFFADTSWAATGGVSAQEHGLMLMRTYVRALAGVTAASAVDDAPHRSVFDASVRAALTLFHDSVELPRSHFARLNRQKIGADPHYSAMQFLLTQAITAVAQRPASAPFARAVEATYLQPPRKREAVAHALRLPYGTYRHQLRRGLTLVADELWRQRGAS
jgi:hypothetical protein